MSGLPGDLVAAGYELEETHISWVFLDADDVYKVKKPVDLGFLDFSTLAARRQACDAEVALNRRLAPDVYLGVVPLTRSAGGALRIGGHGQPVEWAVHMRRLAAATRADHLLARGALGRDQLTAVAERLARFHHAARADADTARFGAPEAIARNVRENFRQVGGAIEGYLTAAEAAEIESWQLDFLDRRRALFEARASAARVRDGHGDLRLEHLYLEEPVATGAAPPDRTPPDAATAGDPDRGIVIVDCIEFNERFRYADVCADVAFLSMDLAAHGHADLAEHLLARYARAANDYDLFALVDFYQSYRAYVRAKVAVLLAADQSASESARERARAEAHRHFKLALAAERPELLAPVVIAVGGPIASGKSTVAEWIAHHRSAPVIDTDRTRKDLLGVAPTDKVWHPPFAGGYSPEITARVYDEVLRRAAVVLDSGRAVVVDASFRSRSERAAVRDLARERGVGFLFVECSAGRDRLLERLQERQRRTGVSDGRIEILDDFLASWEAVTELGPDEHLRLDTELDFAATERVLRSRVAFWPERLPG